MSIRDCLAVHRTGWNCTFHLSRNETVISGALLGLQFHFCLTSVFPSYLYSLPQYLPSKETVAHRESLAQNIFQVVFQLSFARAEMTGVHHPLGSLPPFAVMVNMSPGSPSAKMVSTLEQPSHGRSRNQATLTRDDKERKYRRDRIRTSASASLPEYLEVRFKCFLLGPL